MNFKFGRFEIGKPNHLQLEKCFKKNGGIDQRCYGCGWSSQCKRVNKC